MSYKVGASLPSSLKPMQSVYADSSNILDANATRVKYLTSPIVKTSDFIDWHSKQQNIAWQHKPKKVKKIWSVEQLYRC